MRNCVSISWATASQILFSQPMKIFNYIRRYPFARGLPSPEILQERSTAAVLKEAIACDGIYKSKTETKNKRWKEALEKIWRNGWLHAEMSDNDIHYVFASQIHRW